MSDLNGDKALSFDEYKTPIDDIMIQDFNEYFAYADLNSDNVLSLEEFILDETGYCEKDDDEFGDDEFGDEFR